MTGKMHRLSVGAIISLLAFGLGGPLHAQYTTSTLGVTIVDTSGAAVPDATISVRGVDTGLQKTSTSGSNGSFIFNALPIGTYAVTVEKAGFSTFTQTGITLTVNQPVNIPVTLKVGGASEQVTVTAEAPMLDTETATVGQLTSNKSIVDLPLNGRTPQTLLFLAAGTANETGKYCLVNCQGGVYPGEQDANVGGAGTRSVNYQMDGGNHNDSYLNTNLPFPNPDAIQEFNVETDNLSAQYGIGAGAVVNIVTKSGTNSIHGSAFEFVRNGDLNAKNYFAPTHDTLKRNQYGFAVGGPILKSKLFYFGTYQGTKTRSSALGNVAFVPTAAERTGDFSASGITVTNPATGVPYPGDQIPVSAPAQYFLSHIPLPNGPNGELTYQGPSVVQNDDQYLIKANWNQTKNSVVGSWFWTRFYEPPDLSIGAANVIASDGSGNQVTIKNLALNDTYTLSPRVLFNTWYSWTTQTGGSLSGAPFSYPAAGVLIAAPTPPELSMTVGGFFKIATNHLGTFDRGDYSLREDITMERGAHDLHIGGEALHVYNNLVNTYNMSGSFTFSGNLSGSNISDFVLGTASNFQQGGGEYKNLSGILWSLYVQDNIRISPKLKGEVGLRWDPYYPYHEARGRIVCYLPGLAESVRFPNAPSGMLFGGDPGCPSGGSLNNDLNFAPRLGLSYQVDRNTVVRGGAGLYFTPPENHESNGMVDTAPFSPLFNYAGNVNFANPYSSIGIPNPFPAQYATVSPTSSALFTLPVSIYGTFQHNWHMPELATWNLNVERQLGPTWVARISYSGNKGTFQNSGVLGFDEQNPAVYISGASTTANTQQRRLNPQFGSVGLFASNNDSHYEGIRMNVEKRLSHGFSFLANYSHSRMEDDYAPSGASKGQSDPFNRRFDYGISNDDIPNVFNLSGTGVIPSAPLHGLAGKLLNGWGVTGLINWRSGYTYSIFSGVDNSLSGIGSDRADYVGGDTTLDSGRPHGELVQEYYDVSAFAKNAIGTFGNSGKNILRGPRYFDTDTGLLKNFSIMESRSLQFRAEFFNVFNNVNFGQPGNTLGSTSVGKITAANDPRILQLALKLNF